MPRHSLFPNSIAITYTSNGHTHKQVLPILSVTPSGGSWTVETRDAAQVDWVTAVTDYAELLAAFLDTSSTVDSASLYTYEATGSPAEWLATTIIGETGSAGDPADALTQWVMPFKSVGGGSLRLTVIEGYLAADERETFGTATATAYCDMAEFILSDDDWIIVRGGDFPVNALGYTTKINDKLRKRYFLT